MPPEFEDDELEGLSAEELAAIGDDDDEAAILQSIAGNNEDDADDGADAASAVTAADDPDAADDGVQPAANDKPAAETKPGEKAPSAAPAAEAPAPADRAPEFQPTFTADVPDDIDAKLTDIDERSQALIAKLDEGDIDIAAFMAENQKLNDERMQLRIAQEQSAWSKSQNETMQKQRWQWEQDRFFGQEKSGIYNDPIVLAAFSASVQQLAGDAANSNRAPGWFLEEADRQVRERMNIGAPRQEKVPKPNRQPDLSATPKTLANLPAAEIPDTGADEFAYLEKLLDKDPMAYEAALRKLTPEQEARYLGVA